VRGLFGAVELRRGVRVSAATAPSLDVSAPSVSCRVARAPWEVAEYRALRRKIFCDEQRLFELDDSDGWDDAATPIVAVLIEGEQERVVGVVRVYEASQGVWYGGRLGVDAAYRRIGNIGRQLIVKAVTTANAWGCREFLAVVQPQNVPLFRRLHWSVVGQVEAHGLPHSVMVADLVHYPPSTHADVALRSSSPRADCHDAA
jgi:putative N-acetyltransferase (TIGR04045 family)